MNNKFSLGPLFSSSIGFDHLDDFFSSVLSGEPAKSASSYPPYNIIKFGEDRYQIEMALAGFSEEDLDITAENNQLKVTGKFSQEDTQEATEQEYLHRGIATRKFEQTFNLAEHVKVEQADLQKGLLIIKLRREVPEEAKPQKIKIASGS